MIAYRLDSNGPAFDRVTRFAIPTKLPAMDVRMAICAFLTNVREHQFDMAAGARNFFMHSTERVARLVMFEFRDTADGFPAQRCMAVFAGNGQCRTMGIAGNLLLPRTNLTVSTRLNCHEN